MMDEHTDQKRVENGTWRNIDGVWRRVHGSFFDQGFSIEWHDFRVQKPLDWGPSFHENSLEICLNFSGTASLGLGKSSDSLQATQLAIYTTTQDVLSAAREKETAHRFLSFEFSRDYLRKQFAEIMNDLDPVFRRWLDGKFRNSRVLAVRDLPAHLLLLREHVLRPPVPSTALPLWFEGKIAHLLASLVFRTGDTPELFCHQHHRRNQELVERMLHLLERDMANPPSLEMLAAELAQSPFYLSRIFSEITGRSIPATLRNLRINRAAELLRHTNKPVTEIAFEVGYSSIGAFNKAFSDHFKMPPSDYRTGQKPRPPA